MMMIIVIIVVIIYLFVYFKFIVRFLALIRFFILKF